MSYAEFLKAFNEASTMEELKSATVTFWDNSTPEEKAPLVTTVLGLPEPDKTKFVEFLAECSIYLAEQNGLVSIDGELYSINASSKEVIAQDKFIMGNHMKSSIDGTDSIKPTRGLNADFEGVMPGVDQLIYDVMNAKAVEESCLTSQCLTDKGREALLSSKYPFKLTDMHGGRGVVVKVIPDSEMPKDFAFGTNSEIVIFGGGSFSPEGYFKLVKEFKAGDDLEAMKSFTITFWALSEVKDKAALIFLIYKMPDEISKIFRNLMADIGINFTLTNGGIARWYWKRDEVLSEPQEETIFRKEQVPGVKGVILRGHARTKADISKPNTDFNGDDDILIKDE